ncbi:DNA binding domain-containing protein, excisionase family [[Clostridium] polysaccharolyticum]|uniref:DNA binding domain-containing protein, excisionase family n=2 Tax=[Clostridium] polysaccharolyticum TaxID=29364 RepID=A0A1I0FCE3_9FIRM|nr:DNA binding domain-containing protein, excisionase family [[Clostridium] polysaccharolyticum]
MMENKESKVTVPVCEKYTLTIREAAAYFNIGMKKMRRLAEENTGRFAIFSGNRYLIIRTKFEEFLQNTSTL